MKNLHKKKPKLLLLLFILSTLFLNLAPFSISKAQTSSQSIRFTGSTASRVAVPIGQGGLNIGAGTFTIEFWMKAVGVSAGAACSGGNDVFTNGAIIIDRDIYNEGDYGDFGISLMSDRRLAFSVNNGSGGATACSSALALNVWYYIAATKSGNTIRIYVNGTQSGSATYSGQTNLSYRIGRPTSFTADPYFVFGAEKHTAIGGETFTAYHYNGFLDELRISNIARTITSVNQPFTVDGNTVAMFRFEGNATSSPPSISSTPSGISYSSDVPAFTQPTSSPTTQPTSNPTNSPTSQPTSNPTSNPTANPTNRPNTPNPTSTSTNTSTPSASSTPIDPSPSEITGSPSPSDLPLVTQSVNPNPTNQADSSPDIANNWLWTLVVILILIPIGALGWYYWHIKKQKKVSDVK